jgi:hypothetical protein
MDKIPSMSESTKVNVREISPREEQLHQWGDTHFFRSKCWYKWFSLVQLLAALFAGTTLFATSPTLSALFGLATFACQIVAWIFQSQSRSSYSRAHRAHFTLQIVYGFGQENVDPEYLDSLNSEVFVDSPSLQNPYNFYCCEMPSYVALLRVTEEISFYLSKLYERSEKRLWVGLWTLKRS